MANPKNTNVLSWPPGDTALSKRMEKMNSEELRSALECPVCLEICFPPSYICDRGHLICDKCLKTGIDICPFCRSSCLELSKQLTSFLQRCQKVECSFTSFGCCERDNALNIRDHEHNCQFMCITCPVINCGENRKEISMVEFASHVKTFHKKNCYQFSGNLCICIGGEPDESIAFFTGMEKIVMFRLRQNGNEGIVGTVAFLNRSPTDDFNCKVTLAKGSKAMYFKSGKMLGVDQGTSVAFENEFRLTFRAVQNFVEYKDNLMSLTVKVEIMPASACQNKPPQQNHGCAHYKRRCHIICPLESCGAVVPCHVCHDEMILGHKINRFDIKQIKCLLCEKIQPSSELCTFCDNPFAKYFCSICNMYDDENEDNALYHCQKCGICRKKPVNEYLHCDKCRTCFNVNDPNHQCSA